MSSRSYRRYTDYRWSEKEGIEQIPSHWEVLKLGYVSTFKGGAGFPDKYQGSMEYSLPFYKVGDLSNAGRSNYLNQPSHTISESVSKKLGARVFPPGTIVFAKVGAALLLQRFKRLKVASCIDNNMMGAELMNSALPDYLLYLLPRLDLKIIVNPGAVPSINSEQISSVKIAFPPLSEQQQIAKFLDYETAKIDLLIEKQQALIELLKEKRQAVISHAVTKGLNPQAKMKDSGVEWLGEVPEHWAVVQSRRMFKVRNEAAEESDLQLTASQKYGMLPQKDFVQLEGRRVVQLIKGIDSLRHAEPNDFIISLRSFQGGLEWCNISGSVTFHYVVLTPVRFVHPPYFAHLFKSMSYIHALRATANLIRDGQDLRYSNFIQVDLPIVPLDEQKEIAAYLNSQIVRFDKLTELAEEQIQLLQERRTALISAAVTGKIDVRDWQPNEPQLAEAS